MLSSRTTNVVHYSLFSADLFHREQPFAQSFLLLGIDGFRHRVEDEPVATLCVPADPMDRLLEGPAVGERSADEELDALPGCLVIDATHLDLVTDDVDPVVLELPEVLNLSVNAEGAGFFCTSLDSSCIVAVDQLGPRVAMGIEELGVSSLGGLDISLDE